MIVHPSTVEHPFASTKVAMAAMHFKMKTLKHAATEMLLHVLAYNLKRVIPMSGCRRCSGPCEGPFPIGVRRPSRAGAPFSHSLI